MQLQEADPDDRAWFGLLRRLSLIEKLLIARQIFREVHSTIERQIRIDHSEKNYWQSGTDNWLDCWSTKDAPRPGTAARCLS